MQKQQLRKFIKQIIIMAADYAIVLIAYYIAYQARLSETQLQVEYLDYFDNVYYWALIYIACYYLTGVYKSIWRYTGIDEAVKLGVSSVVASTACFLASTMLERRIPIVVAIIAACIVTLLECAIRILYMLLMREISKRKDAPHTKVNLLIIGAGDAGSVIIREINNQPHSHYNIVGIVDDNLNKKGARLHNINILGNTTDVRDLCAELDVDEIIIAIPSASFEQLSEIIACCPRKGVRIRIMPAVYSEKEIPATGVMTQTKDINLEDLLGREEVLSTDAGKYIEGKTVMVTGGGGSIGSELCNQIMDYNPRQLVIFDIFENNAYDTMNKLKLKLGDSANICIVIGSVTDEHALRKAFERHRPNVVFHAAAYKHVPLMEQYPDQAVRNNIYGTYNTAKLSHEFGVHRFVMVSTDKAVNPTNVMGATKRAAEMIVQAFNTASNTEFVAVRFGNVLGSAGSVVPLFKQQIEAGGPITITHPDITRFFMTIPEAAGLVLQAGAIANGGEVFILDMGKPVRIMDIAYNMIYLSGLVPNQDIEIKIVGLRPGEKLYEELMLKEEGITASNSKKIFIANPSDVTMEEVDGYLRILGECLEQEGDVRAALMRVVPTYKPALNGFHEPAPAEDAAAGAVIENNAGALPHTPDIIN